MVIYTTRIHTAVPCALCYSSHSHRSNSALSNAAAVSYTSHHTRGCTVVVPVLSSTVLYVQYRFRISPTTPQPPKPNHRSLARSPLSLLLFSHVHPSSLPPSLIPPRPYAHFLHIPSLQLALQLDIRSNTWDHLQTSYLALLNRSDALLIKGRQIPSHSPLNDSGLSVPHIHLSP